MVSVLFTFDITHYHMELLVCCEFYKFFFVSWQPCYLRRMNGMLCQDLPSPTTGTFSIHQIKNEQSLLNPVMPEDGISHSSEDPYFRFAPHGGLCNLQSLLRLENQVMNAISFRVCLVSSNFAHNLSECVRKNGSYSYANSKNETTSITSQNK